MQRKENQKVNEFKYLGLTVDCEGSSNAELKRRVQAGWNKWRKVTGVLCDRNMPIGVKGEIYGTCVRPVMLYDMETVPVTKLQEAKVEVAEMRMLRFTLDLTRKNRIRNETVRDMLATRRLEEKLREWRLRWFGRVKRREETYVG
ncbi:uncharacterized protein LOC125034618 [Penaeus chinensis]|uniref:uncharacterized protein LOC125034618 n=1 Tax=Penaeus chinensis TaxID=139456 RepID=UPI001FB61DF2|nr:uncharacterized protein LOC125034618 [Penaeus chinensis]